MNGFSDLLGQKEQTAPVPGAENAPQGMDGENASEHGRQASPEMQAIYNRFVGACMMAIWDEKFMPKVLKMFQDHPNQTDALALVAAGVAQRIYMGARKKGMEIPLEVMLHGGIEVVQQVAELATAGGIEGIEPDEVETAYYLAADKVRDALSSAGMLDLSGAEENLAELKSMVGDEPFSNVSGRMQASQQKTMDGLMARTGNQGAGA